MIHSRAESVSSLSLVPYPARRHAPLGGSAAEVWAPAAGAAAATPKPNPLCMPSLGPPNGALSREEPPAGLPVMKAGHLLPPADSLLPAPCRPALPSTFPRGACPPSPACLCPRHVLFQERQGPRPCSGPQPERRGLQRLRAPTRAGASSSGRPSQHEPAGGPPAAVGGSGALSALPSRSASAGADQELKARVPPAGARARLAAGADAAADSSAASAGATDPAAAASVCENQG